MADSRARAVSLAALGLGSVALFGSASATWAVAVTAVAGAPVPLSGADCLPLARGVAVLALAAVGGLVAARGRARALVGAAVSLVALLGAAALAGVLRGGLDAVAGRVLPPAVDGTAPVVLERSAAGPALAALGLLLVLVGGVVAAATSARWPALGARYERPGTVGGSGPGAPAPPEGSADGMWAALDRGEDPTR